jgi:hypothetical protein
VAYKNVIVSSIILRITNFMDNLLYRSIYRIVLNSCNHIKMISNIYNSLYI